MTILSYAYKILQECYFIPLIVLVMLGLGAYLAFLDFDFKYIQHKKTMKQKSVLSFWLIFFRGKFLHFFTVIALNSFFACRGIFVAFSFGTIVKQLTLLNTNKDLFTFDNTMIAALLCLLTPLIAVCMEFMSEIITSRLMPWFGQSIREYYFDYICDYGYGYTSGNTATVNKIIDIVCGSISFVDACIRHIIPSIVFGIAGLAWFFAIDIYFGLLFLAWIIINTSLSLYGIKRNTFNVINTDYYRKLMFQISDTFAKLPVIKTNRSEQFEKEYFRSWNDLDIGSYRELKKYNSFIKFLLHVIYYIFFNFLFILQTICQVVYGYLDVGQFTKINKTAKSISVNLWDAMAMVPDLIYNYTRASVAIQDLNFCKEVKDDGQLTLDIKRKSGTISFKNISLAYTNEIIALQGFNLELNLGGRYALVGKSGCGKSSIINLLMRFVDPTSGEVLINGVNIKDISLGSLRQAIGLVPQLDSFFFRPIFVNIAYGCEQIRNEITSLIAKKGPKIKFADLSHTSQNRIIQAVATVKLQDIIAKMPNGYDSIYGTEVGLSGGQQQRLSIARAIIRRSNAVLIFDESTSALDAETEAGILQIIKDLPQHMTIIKISHRLYTIKDGYTIISMHNGAVMEIGTHNELLDAKGLYYELYNTHV